MRNCGRVHRRIVSVLIWLKIVFVDLAVRMEFPSLAATLLYLLSQVATTWSIVCEVFSITTYQWGHPAYFSSPY